MANCRPSSSSSPLVSMRLRPMPEPEPARPAPRDEAVARLLCAMDREPPRGERLSDLSSDRLSLSRRGLLVRLPAFVELSSEKMVGDLLRLSKEKRLSSTLSLRDG